MRYATLTTRLASILTLVLLAPPVLSTDDQRLVRGAVEVARTLFESDDMFDQVCGAGTLTDVGDRDALQFLTDYTNHDDWSIQRSAIDMMLSLQHPDGRDVLYRLAEIRNKGVFLKFLTESIASKPRDDLGEFLMGMLEIEDVWVRKFALQSLAVMPVDNKVERITGFIQDDTISSVARAYGYYALMLTEDRDNALKQLLAVAEEGGGQAQEAAAIGLGLVDTSETTAALQNLRSTSTPTVKIGALASLAGFGDAAATKELIETVVNGVGLDSSVAAASIRRMRADRAVGITETLMTSYKLSSDAATRLLESWAWIDADPEKIYDWGLNNDNPDIRMQAIWLVGEREDRAYLQAIAPLLSDEDTGVQCMSSWSIVRILGEEYEPGVEI